MNGLEVIKKAQEKFEAKRIPLPKVLMMTGIEDPRLREICFESNAISYFMLKPAPIEQFEEIIENVINESRKN